MIDRCSGIAYRQEMSALDDQRIFLEFLYEQNLAGRVSDSEVRQIMDAMMSPMKHAGGILDVPANEPLPSDQVSLAVLRQSVRAMRRKLEELHPELSPNIPPDSKDPPSRGGR